MNLYFQSVFLCCGIFSYLLYIEPRLAEYLVLILKFVKVKVAGYWWMLNNHPRNPLVRLKMEIQYRMLIKKLMKNSQQQSEDKND